MLKLDNQENDAIHFLVNPSRKPTVITMTRGADPRKLQIKAPKSTVILRDKVLASIEESENLSGSLEDNFNFVYNYIRAGKLKNGKNK